VVIHDRVNTQFNREIDRQRSKYERLQKQIR
jgi:hypothetical protein